MSANSTRIDQIEKLRNYLQNPGRFCILLLGAPGVGKSHWVHNLQKELSEKLAETQENLCLEKVIEVNLGYAKPKKSYWLEKLEEATGRILLLNEIEKIKPHDHLLFEMLSTDNGKYGFEKKIYECRMVFTSRYSIEKLKQNEDIISNHLFDRISQLVVKLPSFSVGNRSILEDFKATWHKMNFQGHDKLPTEKGFQSWLEAKSHTFQGNFRDLDKIAILWHQFRLIGLPESQITSEIQNQFSTLYSYPEPHTELGDLFQFEKGKTKAEIEDLFKKSFKDWAIKTYGSLKKAADPLKMSHRTMERW